MSLFRLNLKTILIVTTVSNTRGTGDIDGTLLRSICLECRTNAPGELTRLRKENREA